jgi:hypothetical protein
MQAGRVTRLAMSLLTVADLMTTNSDLVDMVAGTTEKWALYEYGSS